MIKLLGRHRHALAEVEIRQVHMERSVFFQVNELIKNQIDILRLSIRRQPHQFVLV